MNKKAFLKALEELPEDFKPLLGSHSNLRYLTVPDKNAMSQLWCPLTAVAAAQFNPPLSVGTMNWTWAADTLGMSRKLGKLIIDTADQEPSFFEGVFARKLRKIFKKQREAYEKSLSEGNSSNVNL